MDGINISWWSDIAFAAIVQKLGAEKAKELLPDFRERADDYSKDKFTCSIQRFYPNRPQL
jgi:hypothetical protein